MGLDASVMCHCFRDGKTTDPPVPREWLEVDEEGYLNLKEPHDTAKYWSSVYQWEQSCCEHEGMCFASEHISNWTGYRLFQEALGEVGWEHFPVLREQLPNANGGLTPSTASAKALAELDIFSAAGDIGTKTVLVDSESGEGIRQYVAAYEGVFILAGSRGIDVGLSEFEFFAVDTTSGKDLFRAIRFRQFTKSGANVSEDREGVVWEDLDTGHVYESGIAISGKQIPWEDGSWQKPNGGCRFAYPSEFHVEQQTRNVADFDYAVMALRTVFSASVATGNPVRWG